MRTVIDHAMDYAKSSSNIGPGTFICSVAIMCIITVTGISGMANAMIAGAVIVFLLGLIVVGGLLSVGWDRARRQPDRDEKERLKQGREARSLAPGRFEEMVPDTHPEWLPLFRAIQALVRDEEALDIADDMALRLRRLHAAFETAMAEAGRSDTTAIREEATDATIAIVRGAKARHEDVDGMIRRQDEARAPQVIRRFTETARMVAGIPTSPAALPPPSASAALQRLIGIAEDALNVDPDLVDANGARVDALVRQHLPRLLEAHADAARASGNDLAAVDDELAEGVEQVRASVEEALAADAQARFERLQTEVAFLRMRRGS